MLGPIPDCLDCRHLTERFTGFFCDAFPDGEGIPVEILCCHVSHRRPYPGDHGIQFEPIA